MKKKVIISSILTIALCLSLIAGSTFALFTSESEVNVAVTAGKVDVVATIENWQLGSTLQAGNLAETKAAFIENTNNIIDNTLELEKIVPGDYVTFDIRIHNNSDVTAKYRTVISLVEDGGLWSGLTVTVDDVVYNGTSAKKTDWAVITPGCDDIIVSVKIALPETKGNEYKLTSCKLAYTVEAIQGNAEITNEWDGTDTTTPPTQIDGVYHITNASEFIDYINGVVSSSPKERYDESNAVLDCNIDLGGYTFYRTTEAYIFSGNFDGQNHTVSNFTIDGSANPRYTSLFGYLSNATVKNLTAENATVIGNEQVSAIASSIYENALVENCHAKNCSIIGVKKVGAVSGYLEKGEIKNCTATNCDVYASDNRPDQAGKVLGFNNGGTESGLVDKNVNAYTNTAVTLISSKADFKDLMTATQQANSAYLGKYIVLTIDINFGGETILGVGGQFCNFSGNFDGRGHTISNFNIDNSGCDYYAGLFNYVNGGSIKNLTVKNATVKGTSQVGALVGCADNGGVIDNCKVENVTVDGYKKVGGLAGYIAGATVTNSSVKNVTVNATLADVAESNEIIGFVNTGSTVSDNVAKNVIVNRNTTVVANGVVKVGETYNISTAEGLKWCATNFNTSDGTRGKTFKLVCDIDMTGIEWTPWCNEAQYFCGAFDGSNHTIKNLTINDTAIGGGHATGFIGRLGVDGRGEKCVKDVTFENATVTGYHNVGVAVGYNEFGSVDNVHVKNSTVKAVCVATAANDDPCGDKAGALVGFVGPDTSASVTNCSAENCTVIAARDAAQLVGYGYAQNTFSGNSANNVTVRAEAGDCTHSRAGIVSADALVGNGTEAGLAI